MATSFCERDLEYAEELQLWEVVEASKLNSIINGTPSLTDTYASEIFNRIERLEQMNLKITAKLQKCDSDIDQIFKNVSIDTTETDSSDGAGREAGKKRKSEDDSLEPFTSSLKRRFDKIEISHDAAGTEYVGKGKGKVVQTESEDEPPTKIQSRGLFSARHNCQTCFEDFSTFDISGDMNKMATSSANLGVILRCKHAGGKNKKPQENRENQAGGVVFMNRRLNINLTELLAKHKSRDVRINYWLQKMLEEVRCGYCNMRFNTLPDLENHLNQTPTHESFLCCGKLFRFPNDLKRHKDVVHPEAAH
ncbi:7710_t:CDS:2 [Acaulospora colombiana]|uniref:7710_t:CDS:1 n=1 Tax=Acaulospora colombiana TaxID=27376 RepID=A0ACA9KUK8_9GLOM|nr:7710_t:CDS:2 [Acaulospora colombiana]